MLAFGSGIKILASRFSKHLSSNSNPRSLVLRALRPRKLMTSSVGGPVQIDIVNRLSVALEPLHLAIENESYKHSVPKGSETHFKVQKLTCKNFIVIFLPFLQFLFLILTQPTICYTLKGHCSIG